MTREINIQKLRILLAYAVLGAVLVLQWHFVVSGIMALPLMNSVIIAVFIFGNILIWRSLASLRHEITAMALIAEAYGDTHAGPVTDAMMAARRQRCLRPGVLLKHPKILGSAFDILMDEFWRGRSLRFRLETVQMLMATVDHKMARERGLIGYVSGLAIFLGLIGTFIGLMEMVASVGGIIGSLAGANASADSIQRLITALQAPLTGMAQGFSASLFGLFASLALGIIGRFSAAASYSVKEQFESWLTGVSQLEQVRQSDHSATAQDSALGQAIPALTTVSPSYEAAHQALTRAAEAQAAQARQFEILAERFEAVAINHSALNEIMRRTDHLADEMMRLRDNVAHDQQSLRLYTEDAFAALRHAVGQAQAHHGALESQMEALRASFDARFEASERRAHDYLAAQRAQADALTTHLTDAERARDVFHADMVARQADVVANLRRMEAQLASAPDPSLVTSSIRGALLDGFHVLAQKLEQALHAHGVASQQVNRNEETERLAADMRQLTQSLEASLTRGLGDLATSFHQALTLYADLMRQTQAHPSVERPAQRDVG